MTSPNSISSKCVATIRGLAIDMVEKAKSGHPGAPMGLAPLAFQLFTSHMAFNPSDLHWIGRDRFVLSNGHACALQYAMLHLLGYPLSIDDLKQFRQLNSKTPGHPERHITPGIEVSTGPLGQGVSNAVGLAIAEAHLSSTFNRPSFPIFDNYTFCIVGDGCLQEGVASEALSLAGHLLLGKLIVFYDDNKIQIDGETELAFTEDVMARMSAYGFQTFSIEDGNDLSSDITDVIEEAKKDAARPSFIRVRTTIGFGSPNQGTEKVHGSPLGSSDAVEAKTFYGLENPQEPFQVSDDVKDFFSKLREKMILKYEKWQNMFRSYAAQYPSLVAEIHRRTNGALPDDHLASFLPTYTPSDPPMATRKLSETVLNAIGERLPELIGGSADLTASNLTRWKTAVDFQAHGSSIGSPSGRYIRFGVREHAMAAICNGLSAYGLLLPMAATFLNFITYAWGAVRLSCLSGHQVIYVMTHDSIGLGEDGPTHQPIEALAVLRATPCMTTIRPADGNEVSGAYIQAIMNKNGPTTLCLSRQNLPQLSGTSLEKVAFGAYVLNPGDIVKNPDIVLVASGSEVSLVVEAAKRLPSDNICASVVSMPSWELFERQPASYKESVFPRSVPVISVEAGSTFGWSKYASFSLGIDTFGASAPASHLYCHFGLTVDKIIENSIRLTKNEPAK